MNKIYAAILIILGVNYCSFAYSLIAIETSRSEYENEKITYSGKGEFKWRFEIDEELKKATVTEYTRLRNDSTVEYHREYIISYIDEGTSELLSLKDKSKAKQRIICLVGNPGTLATETILIGDNFFEYCKASSGKFYLATGIVKKSIQPSEDINNLTK